jgi:hypothetical protein
MIPVLILSLAICVTMFALGFGLLLPISSAFSAFADFVGVAAEWWFSVCYSPSGSAAQFPSVRTDENSSTFSSFKLRQLPLDESGNRRR